MTLPFVLYMLTLSTPWSVPVASISCGVVVVMSFSLLFVVAFMKYVYCRERANLCFVEKLNDFSYAIFS